MNKTTGQRCKSEQQRRVVSEKPHLVAWRTRDTRHGACTAVCAWCTRNRRDAVGAGASGAAAQKTITGTLTDAHIQAATRTVSMATANIDRHTGIDGESTTCKQHTRHPKGLCQADTSRSQSRQRSGRCDLLDTRHSSVVLQVSTASARCSWWARRCLWWHMQLRQGTSCTG